MRRKPVGRGAAVAGDVCIFKDIAAPFGLVTTRPEGPKQAQAYLLAETLFLLDLGPDLL
jgi:hypothetical protein